MCSVPGRDSGQHSTRDTVTEPEEGETDANRTERNGFGEKDDEGVCVRVFFIQWTDAIDTGMDTRMNTSV